MKTKDEKMQWIRSNWTKLKQKGQLKEAISRAYKDEDPLTYTIQDIIDIEESMGGLH